MVNHQTNLNSHPMMYRNQNFTPKNVSTFGNNTYADEKKQIESAMILSGSRVNLAFADPLYGNSKHAQETPNIDGVTIVKANKYGMMDSVIRDKDVVILKDISNNVIGRFVLSNLTKSDNLVLHGDILSFKSYSDLVKYQNDYDAFYNTTNETICALKFFEVNKV